MITIFSLRAKVVKGGLSSSLIVPLDVNKMHIVLFFIPITQTPLTINNVVEVIVEDLLCYGGWTDGGNNKDYCYTAATAVTDWDDEDDDDVYYLYSLSI